MKAIHSIFDFPIEYQSKVEKRFWSKVEKTEGCWIWSGHKIRKGYGRMNLKGNRILTHRLSYELTKGAIPVDKVLDHYVCNNPSCVNPEHLKPVTNGENQLRGTSPWAQNARKTHCPKGHPLTEGNLVPYELKRGHRICLVCQRLRDRQKATSRIERVEYQRTYKRKKP